MITLTAVLRTLALGVPMLAVVVAWSALLALWTEALVGLYRTHLPQENRP